MAGLAIIWCLSSGSSSAPVSSPTFALAYAVLAPLRSSVESDPVVCLPCLLPPCQNFLAECVLKTKGRLFEQASTEVPAALVLCLELPRHNWGSDGDYPQNLNQPPKNNREKRAATIPLLGACCFSKIFCARASISMACVTGCTTGC